MQHRATTHLLRREPRPWPSLVLAALFTHAAIAEAVEADDPEAVARQLEESRATIGKLTERVRVLAKEQAGLSREVQVLEAERQLAEGKLREASALLASAQTDAAGAAARAAAAQQELYRAREDLRQHAVAAARVGPPTLARLALSASRARELAFCWDMAAYLLRRASRSAVALRAAVEESALARNQAARTAASAEAAEREASARRTAAETARERARALLGRIEAERGEQEKLLAEEVENARRLEALYEALKAAPEAALPPPGPESILTRKGSIAWPAPGPVTRSFGRHRHPKFGTYTISNGIEIGAPMGAPVQCIHPGRVVYAGWFTGYGYLVILDHGEKVYSLYAHLDGLAVVVGDVVEAGHTMATVSDTGSVTGPGLYFEIRRGNQAENPREWLGAPGGER